MLSLAYPLASRFRTGVTLAMFTLVVFTLVTGATTTGSFVSGFNNIETFGGGFDIRATTAPASPIRDMRTALSSAAGVNAIDFRVVASESVLPIEARQVGSKARLRSPISCTALDHGIPRQHDVQVRRDGDGLQLRRRRCGTPSRGTGILPSSTR